MALTEARPKAWLRPLFFAFGAAMLYGGWAFRANRSSSAGAALRAAITQACSSFIATGTMTAALEALFRLGRTPSQAFWISAVGAAAFGASVAVAAHAITGTPNLALTVAPTVAVGTTYSFIYAWRLRVGQR